MDAKGMPGDGRIFKFGHAIMVHSVGNTQNWYTGDPRLWIIVPVY